MTFRAGQKVVCVNAKGQETFLQKDTIYTITSFNGEYVRISEDGRGGHFAWRFRPLVERKTSIEIFTAMLKPSKVDA